MTEESTSVSGFSRVSSHLEEVASARGKLGEIAEGVCGVAKVCLDFLARHKETGHEKGGPETMQLFGGFFQGRKLPFSDAFQSEAGPLQPEEILAESGLLFISSVQACALGSVPHEDRQPLSQAARKLGDQMARSRTKAKDDTRARIDRLGEEIKDLDNLASREKDLQDKLAKARKAHSSILDRIKVLEVQSAGLSDELAKSKDEEEKLKVEVSGLRARKKEIDQMRSEVKELTAAVAAGEKEIDHLRKKKADLDQKKVEISTRMMDTKEMLEQAEKTIDTSILDKIKQIWTMLPVDKFDEVKK